MKCSVCGLTEENSAVKIQPSGICDCCEADMDELHTVDVFDTMTGHIAVAGLPYHLRHLVQDGYTVTK